MRLKKISVLILIMFSFIFVVEAAAPLAVAAKKSTVSAGFWGKRRKKWIHPLKTYPYFTISKFGAPRSRGRVHAGIDFLVHKDTPVYSMTSGKISGINKTFYKKGSGGYLHAVEVKNDDGSYAVYGEVMELKSIKIGMRVKKGQKIAVIRSNNDSYGATRMLHLEMYKGTSSGSFYIASSKYKYVKTSRGVTFSRRSDLINPMGVLKLKKKRTKK